jgi:hypothetical protein
MPGSLKLSIDTFTLEIFRFEENGYDRMPVEMGDTTYSLLGAPIDDGGHYEAPYMWTIGARLSVDDWHMLQAMFRRQELKRRTTQNYAIRVDDRILRHVEDVAVPTRAIVAGETVRPLPLVGAVAYFARFDARLFQPNATIGQNQKLPYAVRFVLKELDKVAP